MPSVIPLAGPAEKPVPEVHVLAMSQDEKRLWKCERRSYRIACKWIACVDAYLFCREVFLRCSARNPHRWILDI